MNCFYNLGARFLSHETLSRFWHLVSVQCVSKCADEYLRCYQKREIFDKACFCIFLQSDTLTTKAERFISFVIYLKKSVSLLHMNNYKQQKRNNENGSC